MTRKCAGSIWLSDATASSLIPSTRYWSVPPRPEDENGKTAMLTVCDCRLDADTYTNTATLRATSNINAAAAVVLVGQRQTTPFGVLPSGSGAVTEDSDSSGVLAASL